MCSLSPGPTGGFQVCLVEGDAVEALQGVDIVRPFAQRVLLDEPAPPHADLGIDPVLVEDPRAFRNASVSPWR